MRSLTLPPLQCVLLSVASLALLLHPPLLTQCAEVAFFTDVAPLYYAANASTPTSNSSSNSTFTAVIPYSFSHLTTSLLFYTNATNLTVTLANSSLSLPIRLSQLPSSSSTPTSANLSYVPSILVLCLTPDCPSSPATLLCASFLPSACQLSISLASTLPSSSRSPLFSLSIYHLTSLPLSTTATAQLSPTAWRYYSTYITGADLDVYYDLSITPNPTLTRTPNVDFYLASPSAPLYFIFPDLTNPNDRHAPGTEEGVLLFSAGGAATFEEGVYITGIYAPSTSAATTQYQLSIGGGYDQGETSFGLSLFAIVGALIILVLCLLTAVAVIARRRRYAIREFNESMQAAAVTDDAEALRRLQLMAAMRGMNLEGVLLMPQPQPHGVSEEEIRALPEYRFTRRDRGDGAGVEGAEEEWRCTICLDEYSEGESVLKRLGCGHEFHAACISEWLKTARHPVCPLCLQNVRHAHDVAKKGNGEAVVAEQAGVELQQVRPKVAVDVEPGDDELIGVVHVHEEERKEEQ